MTTAEKIRQFITTNFYVPDPTKLANDASFLDQGIIDSTGVLEVVIFCLVTRIGGLKAWAQEAFRADETRLS